jgi:hypothetical protein
MGRDREEVPRCEGKAVCAKTAPAGRILIDREQEALHEST